MTETVQFTPCQERATELLDGDASVFVTGGAGTGKSFLIRTYLATSSRSKKEAARNPILASTGAAAVMVAGRTFHSFFGLGIFEGGIEATIDRALQSRETVRRIKKAEEIVIDEISMLSGATLYAAEQVARRARDPLMPWGGLRVIAVGDFAQLPPVEGGRGFRSEASGRDWAFLHRVWDQSHFQVAYLQTQTRSQDQEYLRVLAKVRRGIVDPSVEAFLKDRSVQPEALDRDITRLFPRRDDADRHNQSRLAEIPGDPVKIDSLYSGDERGKEFLRKSAPVAESLHIKVGALVMLRQNDPAGKYVNGSLGHITRIGPAKIAVELMTGRLIEVERVSFNYYDNHGEPIASVINFPLTLAWATTIHKSQGATLDRLAVDLKRLWEPGQAYVALSRVRDSRSLYVTGWDKRSIQVDPAVSRFYSEWEV